MSSLNVYYDGTNFVPLEKVNLKPNQEFSITIHDEDTKHPLSIANLTKEEFDVEIQKGFDSINAGRHRSASEVRKHYTKKYNL